MTFKIAPTWGKSKNRERFMGYREEMRCLPLLLTVAACATTVLPTCIAPTTVPASALAVVFAPASSGWGLSLASMAPPSEDATTR